jgi:hypothetical protein
MEFWSYQPAPDGVAKGVMAKNSGKLKPIDD